MPVLIKKSYLAGKNHNYLIAGNLSNAFALGEVGSPRDFFLLGADPGPDEIGYPLLTGTILNPDGEVLCRLVRNTITVNPGNCSRKIGDRLGYEIHDRNGVAIFKAETRYNLPPEHPDSRLITTLSGSLYNQQKQLVFRGNSGAEDERIDAGCKVIFGFQGSGVGHNHGMTEEDLFFAKLALETGGRINEVVGGAIRGPRELVLNGRLWRRANVSGCTIQVNSGDFLLLESRFEHNSFQFHGQAAKIRELGQLIDGRPR